MQVGFAVDRPALSLQLAAYHKRILLPYLVPVGLSESVKVAEFRELCPALYTSDKAIILH